MLKLVVHMDAHMPKDDSTSPPRELIPSHMMAERHLNPGPGIDPAVRRRERMRWLILQNCPAEGIGLYASLIKELGIVQRTLHPYAGESFPPLDRYDAIIVGGTPVSVNMIRHHGYLMKEGRFLAKALNRGKPVLGICFGAQLLARLLGAVVERNPVTEIGIHQVRLTADGRIDALFRGFPEIFPVFQWHADTFTIPPGASWLAWGPDCPYQAFRQDRAIGIQFHLEVTAAEAGRMARAYPAELALTGKTKIRIVKECRAEEQEMKRLSRTLMENALRFFS